MQLQDFMQFQSNSGNIGKGVLASNRDQIHFLDYDSRMAEDGFLHMIYSASFTTVSRCSYELTVLPCYHFLSVTEGTMEVVCDDGSSCHADSGQYLFLSPSDKLQFSIKSGHCRFFQVGVLGAALNHYRALLPTEIDHIGVSAASGLTDCIGHLLHHKLYHSQIDTVMYSKWLNDIFTELCVLSADSSLLRDQIPSYIREIKLMFDENYQETYSLADLERRFETSRYRLCREFTHYFGRSPIQYLNHRRIEAAKVLLVSTNLSVHEVGSSVGIDNTNHFINLFKKETGATPLVFKQEAPAVLSELHSPCAPDGHPQ